MKSRLDIIEDMEKLRVAMLSGTPCGSLSVAEIEEVIAALKDDAWRERIEDIDSNVWNIIAEHDLREVCEFLLENQVAGERWSQEPSPMMIAVESGNLEIVRMMVGHGWSPNHATDISHESPLMLAADAGNEDMFFYLVEHGAKLEHRWRDMEIDMIGEDAVIDIGTLLKAAVDGRSRRIVEYLKSKLE